MTLNQLLQRIRTIALSHKQIRKFKVGLVQDLFDEKTSEYPACVLQYDVGNVSIADKRVTVSLRMFVLDLVNVADDTKTNQDEVLSDTLSIIQDLYAQMLAPSFQDWRIATSGSLQGVIEGENDLAAGWSMDFAVSFMFTGNICDPPSILNLSDIDFSVIYLQHLIDAGIFISTILLGPSTASTPDPTFFLGPIGGLIGKQVVFLTINNVFYIRTSSFTLLPQQFNFNSATGMFIFPVDIRDATIRILYQFIP